MSPEEVEQLVTVMAGTGQEIDEAQVTGVVVFIDDLLERRAVDWEPLGENIEGHTIQLWVNGPHEDDRWCVYHARLSSWVFDNDKRCLREHP